MDAESEILAAIIDAATARYPVVDPPGWYRGAPPAFELVTPDGTPVRTFERCFGRHDAWWCVVLTLEEYACDDGLARGPARVRLLGATPAGGWAFDAASAREIAAALEGAAHAAAGAPARPEVRVRGIRR